MIRPLPHSWQSAAAAAARPIAFLAFLLLAANSAAFAQTPEPGEGSAQSVPTTQDENESPRLVFAFHSGFWLNLHHFLYEQARIRDHQSIDRGGPEASLAPAGPPPKLVEADSPAWRAAVDYYARNIEHRDLLLDESMVLIKNRLADLELCPYLSGRQSPSCTSGLRPGMIAALESAAPIYRRLWWPDDDRKNRQWIEAVAPYVRRMGLPLADQLSAVYHSPWQAEPIRVDVVAYAGPFGAYTTLDPTHITVSSIDPRNQGLSAFEILFHEASHALATAVQDAIIEACHQRGVPIPRDLWHALLFYTTGEMVRREAADGKLRLANAGITTPPKSPDAYTPYAYRYGLYSRGWENYQRLLEAYWKPYLDGKVDFQRAINSLVANS